MTSLFAATRTVNTPGLEPVLTEAQLWRGLEYKARNPEAFVPNILSSQTIVDEGNKLVRELTRTQGNSTEIVKEEIESYAATIMYFETSTGLRLTNIISYGPDNEMLLTYCFAGTGLGRIPGGPADKPNPSAKELNEIIGQVMDRNLGIFRRMVKEGKL
ncbi:DUF1857-domain-containing protein [Mycena latifolia]|nr:DUF1857-domain-containing protein [Mycena latifolia]